VRHLSKSFPGLKALDDVNLEVRSGEIVAVVGHNGSGKSTLTKILAGLYEPDPGALIQIGGPGEPVAQGRRRLHVIHQDLGIIDVLSAVENMGLCKSPLRPTWFARGTTERDRAAQLIGRFGGVFDPTVPVGTLSAAERAIIAIARAMDGWDRGDNILVLDEPTTAFHGDEVEVLFRSVRKVAEAGAGVVLISHRLDEVLGLSDRVVALRDGRVVADQSVDTLDYDALVGLIAGRSLEAVERGSVSGAGAPIMNIEGVAGQRVRNLSMRLRAGEIVGVSGVLGSGREELASLIFGARRRTKGRVLIGDAEVTPNDIRAAIANGLAFLPPDRRRGGGVMDLSVRENLTLPMMSPLRRRLGRLDRRAERAETERWAATVALRPPDPERPLKLLSGGNQQKVLLARWLRTKPRVLLLDEPTQGVDVGAKAAIYELIIAAARQGAGVLVCSSDAEELVALCDRVLVLDQGEVRSELSRESLTQAGLAGEVVGFDGSSSACVDVRMEAAQ